ncbi:uncharacterized protein LOC143043519 [Mytilus galloprovincialis]|uniref:uncharacterized protein LOC143043519 n=1 Tax=Mytilus galloprovincialis TaxID=29158 RepID=UPI003F7BD24D
MFLVHALIWICMPKLCIDDDLKKDKSPFNSFPMFVRVFLYDTNFDLKLEDTDKAEGHGALMAKGEIDVTEADQITILQTKLDSNLIKIDQLKERNDKQNQKVLNRQKEMDKDLKELKKLIIERLDTMKGNLRKIEHKAAKTAKYIEAKEEDTPDNYSRTSDEFDSEKNL